MVWGFKCLQAWSEQFNNIRIKLGIYNVIDYCDHADKHLSTWTLNCHADKQVSMLTSKSPCSQTSLHAHKQVSMLTNKSPC